MKFTVTSKFTPGDPVHDTVRETDAIVQFVSWTVSEEAKTPELTYRIVFNESNEQHGRHADVSEDQLIAIQ